MGQQTRLERWRLRLGHQGAALLVDGAGPAARVLPAPFVALPLLDFRLWPDSPVLMHLHNLAWFALLVFLAGWIYRGVLA